MGWNPSERAVKRRITRKPTDATPPPEIYESKPAWQMVRHEGDFQQELLKVLGGIHESLQSLANCVRVDVFCIRIEKEDDE